MTALASPTAEQSVIGACLVDNDAFWKITGVVSSADFTDDFLRTAFRAIMDSAERGDSFDLVTLSEKYDIDLAALGVIVRDATGSANVVAYANIVRKCALTRQAVKEISAARDALLQGDSDAIFELQVALENLQRNDIQPIKFEEILRTGFREIQAAQKRAAAGGGIAGAPSGIDLIDQRLNGFEGGKLIILAARPSLGKTALTLQAAQAAAKAGFPVGFLSLEMGAGEIAVRSFAHEYQVNNTALSAGDNDTVSTLARKVANDSERADKLKKLPIYVDEDSFTIGGIIGRITEWHRKHKIKLVIIDHLQLISLPAGFNRNDGLGEITRKLKILAKRLDVPIILLCQLNRNVEREQRKPKLSDLRDSGNIEQDADIVLSLAGPLESDSRGMREVEIGFLKFRGGLVGWVGTLIFNGATQTFRRMEFRYD